MLIGAFEADLDSRAINFVEPLTRSSREWVSELLKLWNRGCTRFTELTPK